MKPTPKVMAGGLASAVTIILVWVLGLAGVDMPAVVASAVTTVVGVGTGYLTNDEGNAP